MKDREYMVAVVHNYIAAVNRCDGEALGDMFADDATLEDPVGSAPLIGILPIRDFYLRIVKDKPKITLIGPIRTAANCAAFASETRSHIDGRPVRYDIIETFRFDPAGKIKTMEAFFGPENIHYI